MKNVMVRAWEIAKNAVKKFGGKAKDYFSQALTVAWKEIKSMYEIKNFPVKTEQDLLLKKACEKKVEEAFEGYIVKLQETGMKLVDRVGTYCRFEMQDGTYGNVTLREMSTAGNIYAKVTRKGHPVSYIKIGTTVGATI